MMQDCAHPGGKGVIRFQEVIILFVSKFDSAYDKSVIYHQAALWILSCNHIQEFWSVCLYVFPPFVLRLHESYMEISQHSLLIPYTLYLHAGDHEYIDVVCYNDTGGTERVVIDIDFRSHFEIARAVESYDRILNLLPVIYVGSLSKLKQFLQVMVEAARSSLKQNSMPLPPWRSLPYLLAKWQSPYQRKLDSASEQNYNATTPIDHKKCAGHLKRLHSLLLSEIEVERTLKPYNRDRRVKTERRRYPTFH